ncbi:MAG: FtsX-like permease family protein, partial [Gammaproteobacteria bacterium]
DFDAATTFFAGAPGVEPILRLRVDDLFAAREIAEQAFGDVADIEIRPWYEIQASLFNALNMEKIITSFMLLMIVIIGAVNIVSTLVMVVSDKGADIAILRTMGASRRAIMSVFMVQGMIAGIIGTLLGAMLGLALAENVAAISLWLERLINFLLSDGNVYLISHLQTQTNGSEVLLICSAALLISFLATLYPAYRASRVQPAEVLRYE